MVLSDKSKRSAKGVSYGRSAVRKKQSAPVKKQRKTATAILDGEKVRYKRGAYRSMLGIKEGEDIPLTFMRRVQKSKIGDEVSLKGKK